MKMRDFIPIFMDMYKFYKLVGFKTTTEHNSDIILLEYTDITDSITRVALEFDDVDLKINAESAQQLLSTILNDKSELLTQTQKDILKLSIEGLIFAYVRFIFTERMDIEDDFDEAMIEPITIMASIHIEGVLV